MGRKFPLIFENKYVKTDAAILASFLVLYSYAPTFRTEEEFQHFKESLTTCLHLGIQEFYGMQMQDIIQVQNNRQKFFPELLNDGKEGLNRFVNEATILFTHDWVYNKYVEFSQETSLLQLDAFDQVNINLQSDKFFSIMFDELTNLK